MNDLDNNICVICLYQIVTPVIPEMPLSQNPLRPELHKLQEIITQIFVLFYACCD